MSSISLQERNRLAQLKTDYRKAWNHLLSEVEILQAATHEGTLDTGALAVLRTSAEQAGNDYRIARDAMAIELLHKRDAAEDELAMSAGCHCA